MRSLRGSGLQRKSNFKSCLPSTLLPGALDLVPCGSLDSTIEIHFKSPGFGPSGLRCFSHFKTLGVTDLMTCGILDLDGRDLLRVSEASGLWDFGHFRPLGFSTSGLWPLRHFGLWPLRDFGPSGFGPSKVLCTSHFETPEVHFPKGLDRLPPVLFKINDSCLFWGFVLWRYTLHDFGLPNARELLI
jgi:hypothetical protein